MKKNLEGLCPVTVEASDHNIQCTTYLLDSRSSDIVIHYNFMRLMYFFFVLYSKLTIYISILYFYNIITIKNVFALLNAEHQIFIHSSK